MNPDAKYLANRTISKFQNIEFMKLLKIVNMMVIKEHWQVWTIRLLIKKHVQE